MSRPRQPNGKPLAPLGAGMAFRMAVADVLSRARVALGLSQKKLASELGMRQAYWSRIERGERSPSLDEWAWWCARLNLEPVAALRAARAAAESDAKRIGAAP